MCVYIKLTSVCQEKKVLKKGKNKPYSFCFLYFFFSFQILEILPDLALTVSIFMEEWSRNTVVKDITAIWSSMFLPI